MTRSAAAQPLQATVSENAHEFLRRRLVNGPRLRRRGVPHGHRGRRRERPVERLRGHFGRDPRHPGRLLHRLRLHRLGTAESSAVSPTTRTPVAAIVPAISAPIAPAASAAQRGVVIFTSCGVGLHAFFICMTAPLRTSLEYSSSGSPFPRNSTFRFRSISVSARVRERFAASGTGRRSPAGSPSSASKVCSSPSRSPSSTTTTVTRSGPTTRAQRSTSRSCRCRRQKLGLGCSYGALRSMCMCSASRRSPCAGRSARTAATARA